MLRLQRFEELPVGTVCSYMWLPSGAVWIMRKLSGTQVLVLQEQVPAGAPWRVGEQMRRHVVRDWHPKRDVMVEEPGREGRSAECKG